MIITIACGLAALLPSVLLVRYFRRSDKYPEPGNVLWCTFLLGCAIVIPVCVLELVVAFSWKTWVDPSPRP